MLLGVLTVIAVIVDFIAGVLGAKRVGASGWALFGAALGTIVGMFLGLFGLLLGPFVGAVLGELIAGSTLHRSTVVGVGAWLGFLFGTVPRFLCFTMLGVFVGAGVLTSPVMCSTARNCSTLPASTNTCQSAGLYGAPPQVERHAEGSDAAAEQRPQAAARQPSSSGPMAMMPTQPMPR